MASDYDKLPAVDNLKEILALGTPLIDVRAPIEYEASALPNSVNLPLMTDEERHLVGICYKEKGHDAAVDLGHELVSGAVKEERVKAWVDFMTAHPDALVMCFRGGMRSRISQTWISEALGRTVPRIDGGYKAMRQLAIDTLEAPFGDLPAFMLGGHTGAGKTPFLHRLAAEAAMAGVVDLEGLANHRGSAFGNMIDPQPPQPNFENAFAQQLLMHRHRGAKALFFENESRAIGRVMIPQTTMDLLKELPLLVLTSPVPDRVHRTWLEYVVDARVAYQRAYGEDQGIDRWASDLRERLGKIQKRLGLERYKAVSANFEDALRQSDLSAHCGWIETLLTTYYDPMYSHHRDRWEKQVVFEGDAEAMLQYIQETILK